MSQGYRKETPALFYWHLFLLSEPMLKPPSRLALCTGAILRTRNGTATRGEGFARGTGRRLDAGRARPVHRRQHPPPRRAPLGAEAGARRGGVGPGPGGPGEAARERRGRPRRVHSLLPGHGLRRLLRRGRNGGPV